MNDLVTAAQITVAAQRIRNFVRNTAVEYSPTLSSHIGADCYLKMEIWQQTGSFKMRGAANRMLQLTPLERTQGVVTASAGNHALGVCACAGAMKIPAIMVVPTSASPAKLSSLRMNSKPWIELREAGQDYDEAEAYAIALARDMSRTYVSPYNNPAVITGQGTVAVELLADVPDLEMILVPVGGGGLASGVGVWAHHANANIRIIGLAPEASPSMYAALASSRITALPTYPSFADGLVGNIETDSITVPLCKSELEGIVLINEVEIASAIRWLANEHHIIVEGAGAIGVAALLSGAVTTRPGSKVATILTGRNIDASRLCQALQCSGE